MTRSPSRTNSERLINAVTRIADTHQFMAERRQAFLGVLCDLIQADAGWWAWGRGRPEGDAVTPAAIIDFGMSPELRAIAVQSALDHETLQDLNFRVLKQMGSARQSTTIRADLYPDDEWEANPGIRRMVKRLGWYGWLHCVRYSADDTWSNFFLARHEGKPEFGDEEAATVDLAMSGVTWMHSTFEESAPPSTFVGLTPRQKTVLLLLLDGMPRKSIARLLGITEDTVGDHIKVLYARFGVRSASELSAVFLKSHH